MIAAEFSKIGNWYEEGYVVFQALRLLDETIEELVWEGRDEDGRGIDLWIRERSGERVAIQCKTRSTDRWTVRRLKEKRIFEHARYHLNERAVSDRAIRYEFLTNERAHEWEDAIHAARNGDDLAPHAMVTDEIGDGAHAILRRMSVRFQDQSSIEEHARTIAETLVAPSDTVRLLEALRTTLRARLHTRWATATLRQALESADLRWTKEPTGKRFGERIASITQEFVENVCRARQTSTHLVRSEESTVGAAVLDAEPGSLILVRGAPGSGKSEVLAGLVPAAKSDTTLLALNADQLSDSRLGDNVARRLRSFVGEGRAILVIDQVDQLARGGVRHQPALGPVARLVDEARRAGIIVVVGCRTIEASRVSQLENLFAAPGPGSRIDVEIDDLPEPEVAAVLADRGIPLDDLHPDMRRLVLRPVVLSLLVRLVDANGAWAGVRSQLDLIDRWCESLKHDLGDEALAVLDAVAERMDADGTTSVSRSLLSPPDRVDQLVAARILIELPDARVRPFHQVITDTRIALRVAREVASPEGLRTWIGERAGQDLHKARRLRLATSAIAERGQAGADILSPILEDDSVRPLIQHAILMGLATLETPRPPILALVRKLVDDERRRATVARTILYEHEGWMRELEADLDRFWKAWPQHHDLLLQLLASVSVKLGAQVTRHLSRWQGDDPNLLDRAQAIFWHDPAQDCDEQFELRLRSAWVGPNSYPIDWSEFLEKMPLRAIRLLVESLKRISDEDLIGRAPDRRWMYEWPSRDEIPDAVLDLGDELLSRTRVWWSGLDLSDVDVERIARFGLEDRTLVRVAELLARAAARRIAIGALDWGQLLEWIPSPTRALDVWLLLRIGANLEAGTTESVASDAAEWSEQAPKVTEFVRANPWASSLSGALKEFLHGVATRAPSEVTRQLHQQADRLPPPPDRVVRTYSVEPPVSLEEATAWTAERWIEELNRAPHAETWEEDAQGRTIDRSRHSPGEPASTRRALRSGEVHRVRTSVRDD